MATVLTWREGRWDDLPTIAAELVPDLDGRLDRPFALAGIGFGAVLAFEVVGQLEGRCLATRAMFVASQRAPHAAGPLRDWHALDDEVLVERLVEIGGLHPRKAADQEFRGPFLETIRSDLRAREPHRPPGRPSLRCPPFVYRGRGDPTVCADEVEGWRTETSTRAALRILDAGRFLLSSADHLWRATLQADLASLAPSTPRLRGQVYAYARRR